MTASNNALPFPEKNTPPMLRFPPPPYLFKLLKNTSPSPLKKHNVDASEIRRSTPRMYIYM